MQLGTEAADAVTDALFLKPIKLEFEKVYKPLLLCSKKKYAGLKFVDLDEAPKLDCKGIETVRRDQSAIVSATIDKLLNDILVRGDMPGALERVRQQIARLLRGDVDMSELLITKQLKRRPEDYDPATKMAQVELAKRMKTRDPGAAPTVGDRVPYVMVETGHRHARGAAEKAHEKAEDPMYALENDIPLDARWYLDHQLVEPIKRILEPILTASELAEVLGGSHTRVSVSRVSATSRKGLLLTMHVAAKCLGCKAPMASSGGALCTFCALDTGRYYRSQIEVVRRHEQQFAALWTQCQRCTGRFEEDDRCGANTCPIFFKRTRAAKDLGRSREQLCRFSERVPATEPTCRVDLSW